MDVLEALKTRKSTRAFLNKPVEREKINIILDAARYAPSGVNTQPWQVAVISGHAKTELQNQVEAAFRDGVAGKMDYQYYPDYWELPYKERRIACGKLLYTTLNISREDKPRQLAQWAANYRAFDAPVMLLFFLDSALETGSYLDYGMFLQSVMLAAVSTGLASCPQAALAEYPKIVKDYLGYGDDKVLLCGMALGYEDKKAIVNSYRTSREEVNSFVRYFD